MQNINQDSMALECLNKTLDALVVNQERTYAEILAIRKRLDELEKNLNGAVGSKAENK